MHFLRLAWAEEDSIRCSFNVQIKNSFWLFNKTQKNANSIFFGRSPITELEIVLDYPAVKNLRPN